VQHEFFFRHYEALQYLPVKTAHAAQALVYMVVEFDVFKWQCQQTGSKAKNNTMT